MVDSTSKDVAIEREGESVGVVRVHFPRLGYEITPAPLGAATR